MFQCPIQGADALVDKSLEAILSGEKHVYLPLRKDQQVALLVNNLGAVPPMELHILARRAIETIEGRYQGRVTRVFLGSYMTSLDMNGASITVLRLNPAITSLLDESTSCSAWTPALPRDPSANKEVDPPTTKAKAKAYKRPLFAPTAVGVRLEGQIRAVAKAWIEAEPSLTAWDQVAGDGDCGITAKRGAEKVLADCAAHYPLDDPSDTMAALADSVSASMGGTSGALYEISLRSASNSLRTNPDDFTKAFIQGVEAIQFYGGAQAGYRTMLDALLPASAALQNGEGVEAAVAAAEAGADATAQMEALAGRSNYVPWETLRGVPDPGAKAVAIAMRACITELT